MMTGVFSRNIGKLFTELKLATDNFFIQASPSTAYYTLGVTLVILPVYKTHEFRIVFHCKSKLWF